MKKNKKIRNFCPFNFNKIESKKGIVSEYLPWLLIAITILAILLISVMIMKDKGISLIEQIKNIFRN